MNGRIKYVRKFFKLNQTEFAKKVGIEQPTLSQNECGVTPASERTINSICREFHVNEEWLRYGKGEPFVAQQEQTDVDILRELVENAGGNEIILAIMRCWQKLTPPQREALNEFIDKVVDEYQKTKNTDCDPAPATE